MLSSLILCTRHPIHVIVNRQIAYCVWNWLSYRLTLNFEQRYIVVTLNLPGGHLVNVCARMSHGRDCIWTPSWIIGFFYYGSSVPCLFACLCFSSQLTLADCDKACTTELTKCQNFILCSLKFSDDLNLVTVNFGVDKITCEMKISIELKIFRNESIQKSKYHHDGRLLGLLLPFGSSIQFLAYRGVVYISNEAKH